jgi:Fe-coproporphyrin III synthase
LGRRQFLVRPTQVEELVMDEFYGPSGPSRGSPVDNMLERIVGERAADGPIGPAPRVVDLSLSGRCQLRCAWCWGPEHDRGEEASVLTWQQVMAALWLWGTREIVFTGGEPLLSHHLPPLLEFASEYGFRTTLSTNGILLPKKLHLLAHVDDIGIPVDADNADIAAVVRRGAGPANAWDKAINAIRIAQDHVELVTVRTVIARPNLDSIAGIPHVLAAHGVDISRLRFKMYQAEPIGPHFRRTDWSEWAVDEVAATRAASALAQEAATRPVLQLYRDTAGRYVQIDPGGRTYGTDIDEAGLPFEVPYGNVIEDIPAMVRAYQLHRVDLHGRSLADALAQRAKTVAHNAGSADSVAS